MLTHNVKKLLFALLFLLPVASFSQSFVIQVKDLNSGELLIAANIQVKDKLFTTDLNGSAVIDDVALPAKLQISYIGYAEQNVLVTSDLVNAKELIVIELVQTSNILETTTITGSKYEQRLSESTVSVDVIKPRLIKSNNAATADEVLDKVPGVQMIDGQANIRGGSGYSYGAGSRVMLLVNDIPALQSDAGFPNWGDIPIENISQIEILKGAASSLYGSSALNGIINIRTKDASTTPETEFSTSFLKYGDPKDPVKKWWTDTRFNYNVSLVHRRKIDKLGLVVGGFYNRLESFNADTYEKRGRWYVNTKYQVSDRITVGVNTLFQKGDTGDFFIWKNATNAALKPFINSASVKKNFRYFIDPYLTFHQGNNKHKLITRYHNIDNNNNQNQSNASATKYAEYQFQRNLEKIGGQLTAGVVSILSSTSAQLFGDTTFSSQNYAGYVQVDYPLTDNLSVSGGLRQEYVNHDSPENFMGFVIPDGKYSDSELISRVGANYALNEYSSFRASWGQGYRFPTITERFITTTFGSFGIFSNPELRPEKGWTSELGYKQGLKIASFQGFIDASVFWSEYEDMMEFTFIAPPDFGFQSQNVGNTIIKGFELNLFGQLHILNTPISLYGGYTYLDPKYQEFTEQVKAASSADYNVLKYRNKHNFKMDMEADIFGVIVGAAYQRTSHMEAIDDALALLSSAQISDYRAINNEGFNVYDLRIGYKISDLSMTFLIKNVFNEEYTLRPALLEAPRNMALRLDYRI